MKSFLKTVLVLSIVTIILIYLGNYLGILEFSDSHKITQEHLQSYSNYYFNELDNEEKITYILIDRVVKNKEEIVKLKGVKFKNIQDQINDTFTAYLYDNPEAFYLSSTYTIMTKQVLGFDINSIKLEYIDKDKINQMQYELELKVGEIIAKYITDDMTEYKKELVIHDILSKTIDYYKYDTIENIPDIKHTAYGALVENEAVCDGYAKAFKLILNKLGLECIVVSGVTENAPHAWNIVKIEDEYYHVDVTSDNIEKGSKKYVIHAYFNVSDNEIKQTHLIDKNFNIPICNTDKNNFYIKEGRYIDYFENTYLSLKSIVGNLYNKDLLEVKIDTRYSIQTIIDTLYSLNFNNWKTNKKDKITYNNINNVYVFIK